MLILLVFLSGLKLLSESVDVNHWQILGSKLNTLSAACTSHAFTRWCRPFLRFSLLRLFRRRNALLFSF